MRQQTHSWTPQLEREIRGIKNACCTQKLEKHKKQVIICGCGKLKGVQGRNKTSICVFVECFDFLIKNLDKFLNKMFRIVSTHSEQK